MAEGQLPLGGDVKAELLRTDEAFRQLVSEHQALDEKIHRLSSQSFLSHQQQFERVSLKKKKLLLKDRIEAILRGRSGLGEAQASES